MEDCFDGAGLPHGRFHLEEGVDAKLPRVTADELIHFGRARFGKPTIEKTSTVAWIAKETLVSPGCGAVHAKAGARIGGKLAQLVNC